MEEIIKKVSEKFKISEQSARTKVMSKGAQMVMSVFLEDNGEIIDTILQEIEAKKKELIEIEKTITKKKENIEKEENKLDQEKKEFEEIKNCFVKAETPEARDKILLLELYNNIVFKQGINSRDYISGVISILSRSSRW